MIRHFRTVTRIGMSKSKKNRAVSARKKVFIVEDHPVFREGLVQILNSESDLTVCGQADNAAEALRSIARLNPELALVDITLPGRSGLELIKEIRRKKHSLKLLIVSMHDEAIYADRVLRAGADGYIMKQEDPEEIIHAIRDVLSGHTYVSEEVLSGQPKKRPKNAPSTQPERPLQHLTDTELEILEALGQGRSNQEIARQLALNPRAVSAQCLKIRKKLKVKSNNALVRYAVCWLEGDLK